MPDKTGGLFSRYEQITFPYDMTTVGSLHEEIEQTLLRKKLNNFDESEERRLRENTPKPGKTGGWGGTWVELEKPKPLPVSNYEDYWSKAPPKLSERCIYWVRQIGNGWRPNRQIPDCYCCGSEWYGVYIWEYSNVIVPLLDILRTNSVEPG